MLFMIKILKNIKIFVAIVLPIFLLLPIASCERKKDEASIASSEMVVSNSSAKHVDYLVLITFKPKSSVYYWFYLFAFTWPILLIQIKRSIPNIIRFQITLNLIEGVLTTLSWWFVFTALFRIFFKPTTWGYALLIAMSGYAFIFIVETILLYVSKCGLFKKIKDEKRFA